MPRPSVLPEWAMNDVLNEESQQWNVVEPPTEKKLAGWNLGEKPNRQWWNWFQRETSLWIKYFDENLDFDSNTITPIWTGLTDQPTVNHFYYSKEGDRIYFTCDIIWSGNLDDTNPLTMLNLPYPGKNVSGMLQSIPVMRGGGPTAPNGNTLYGLIADTANAMIIYQNDLSTGVGSNLTVKGTSGQLIITGFYFTD